MGVVIEAILPIFALIILGYFMGWRGWLKGPAAEGLSSLTFKLFMPAVLFNGLARAQLGEGISAWLLLAYFLPALLVFVLVNWWGWLRLQRSSPLGLAAGYSNNVLVGIPMVTTLLGGASLVYVFAILVFHSLVMFFAHSLFVAGPTGRQIDYRALLASFGNPLILGLLLGAVVNLSGLDLPEPFWQFSGWLAQAALPCALMVLGISLSRFRPQNSGAMWLAVGGKLVLFPALVWGLSGLLPLAEQARAVLVLLAACPSGVNVLAFVTHKDDEQTIGSCVFLSTALSALSMPLWRLLMS